MRRNIGYQVPTQAWEARQAREADLKGQTNRLCDKLESRGIRTRQEREAISVVGEVTGCVEPLDDYRPIRFLPLVAQRDRAGLLNGLLYFQHHEPIGKYLRLAVVTAGQRVSLYGDLRETISRLSRKISKWASEAHKRYRIYVVYRGTEFTVDSAMTFHVHANVLYAPAVALPADLWAEFLSWSHKMFGAHWHDSGTLNDPNEAIKYPFKPLDIDGMGAEKVEWLYYELSRLKLAQPMGPFADFMRDLKSRRQKVAYVRLPEGDSMQLARIEKDARGQKPEGQLPAPPNRENYLLARTAPAPKFSPYYEPLSYVENYTDAPATEGGRIRLQWLHSRRENSRKVWEKNGAPPPETVIGKRRKR